MNQLLSTPLSTQMDQFWNANRDPKTGVTVREAACDGKDGIKQQVAKEVARLGEGFSAYDISCNLASKGQLVVEQIGSTMILGYLLTNNTVSFTSTSPDTCGTGFCLNDPKFTVHFATEIVTAVRTPGLCQLNADGGTVYVVSASIDSRNAAAEVAKFFGGQKFVAAEVAITNTVRDQPLPLDDSFKELRTSDACTGKTPGVSRILTAFRDLETEIDLRQGIILRAIHAGIAAPWLDGPNQSTQSFFHPMISTTKPLGTAGDAVQISGQYFVQKMNLATALPVYLQRYYDYSVCFGGGTVLESGPVGGPTPFEFLNADATGVCVAGYVAKDLLPETEYQFRARDCDLITCSPWSATLKSTTTAIDLAKGEVVLTLDSCMPSKTTICAVHGGGGTPLGTATVNAQGTFETSITIPVGTSVGAHTIHAVDGDAKAEAAIQVTAPSPAGGSKASIMMVGMLKGEKGCPNHPIISTQTDDTFLLFGAGFAAGTVTVHLDTGASTTLGTATVGADGSFCQQMQSPPGNLAGAHTLVAVQNVAVVAQLAVTFVLPSVIR